MMRKTQLLPEKHRLKARATAWNQLLASHVAQAFSLCLLEGRARTQIWRYASLNPNLRRSVIMGHQLVNAYWSRLSPTNPVPIGVDPLSIARP